MTTPNSSPGRAPLCYTIECRQINVLRVQADDHRVYLFTVHHFVDGVLEANPDPAPTAPAQRLTLRFTTGELVILGTGLDRIENWLNEGFLRALRPLTRPYPDVTGQFVLIDSIVVKPKEAL
jgi:hypothetical protein